MFGLFAKTTKKARPVTALRPLERLDDRDLPSVSAVADLYSVKLGRVLSVAAIDTTTNINGVLFNDRSVDNPGHVLSATYVINSLHYADRNGNIIAQPLPTNSLLGVSGAVGPSINPDGSFTFVAPSTVPDNAAKVIFQYTVTSDANETAVGNVTINLVKGAAGLLAVAADVGAGPHVRVYEAGTSLLKYNFFPYEATFTGGVRVAVGDINNDGVSDIVTVPSAGGGPRLRVFDGLTGATIADEFTIDPSFRGGGNVAVGDFLGDGTTQIAIGAGDGGGPRIQIFKFAGTNSTINAATGRASSFNQLADFFAFDSSQRGGVRVALGDVKGVGRDFLVSAPGPGASPTINVFDSRKLALTGFSGSPTPVLTFVAGNPGYLGGLFVSTGDLNGTHKEQIIVGSGAGTATVSIFSGTTGGLLNSYNVPAGQGSNLSGGPSGPGIGFDATPNGTLISSTIPTSFLSTSDQGITTALGGARVTAIDWNGDGVDEIITGNGPSAAPIVRVFNAIDLTELVNIQAFASNFLGGVSVGAG